jgi:hypothetical protein
MKVECIHGYFKFSETSPGQISHFISQFGLEIERSGDHFTFADLVDAPDYSIVGGTFLGAPCTVTTEGNPWDVMRANGLVYDFVLGFVRPIDSITQAAGIDQAGNYYVSTGMLLPGSVMDGGLRVTDYAAFFLRDRNNFKYSEVIYV